MGPKRRALDSQATGGEPKKNNPEADHELFLQAFEKPTQIYRYLRIRSIFLPVFLPRTLSYMKHRRSVSNARRKSFKVDSLLSLVKDKQIRNGGRGRMKQETLRLSFSGFHIAEFATEAEFADVEVFLLRICQKKRKELSPPIVPVSLARLKVPVNPKPSVSYLDQVVDIPSATFSYKNGHVVRSHVVLFRVQCATLREANGSLVNGDGHSPSDPPIKRRRNGRISSLEEEVLTFTRELVVYDKTKTCLLVPGEYELGVQTSDGTEKLKLSKAWESFNGKNVRPLELFTDYPTLKFSLSWLEQGSVPKSIDNDANSCHVSSPSCDRNGTSDFSAAFEKCKANQRGVLQGVKAEYTVAQPREKESGMQLTPRKRMRVFYQFTHNDSTQQETEARDDLRCPWCCLSCQQLYSLLKHLRLCHSRFNFLYIPHPKGAKIDVSINERYDGSYVGNPQDIHSHVGYAFNRSSPVRRTPITHVMVYRPKRQQPSLSEFQEPETENGINRQLIQGHNRLYFHTVTCQPVQPQELETEGREESKPRWLKQKTVMMIDEFTDVNEGEKELMKMWNLHVMEKEYIGDCMVPVACMTFVNEHHEKIIRKNLSRNFLLHLVNLFDFGLIRPDVLQRTYARLENLRHDIASKRVS